MRWLIPFSVLCLVACRTEYVHVGPNFSALNALEKPTETFDLRLDGPSSGRVGEEIRFVIQSQVAGRLWIFQVDSDDQLDRIYPGEHDGEGRIAAGQRLVVYPQDAPSVLALAEPTGATLVVALVTTGSVDLSGLADGDGRSLVDKLSVLSQAGAWSLAKHTIQVRP